MEDYKRRAILPADSEQAVLAGRLDLGEGPTPVLIRAGMVEDVSAAAPTISDLLDLDDPGSVQGRALFPAAELADRTPFLAPVDLQAIKACGVTFAVSAIERVIEEAARGDMDAAAGVRARLEAQIGRAHV